MYTIAEVVMYYSVGTYTASPSSSILHFRSSVYQYNTMCMLTIASFCFLSFETASAYQVNLLDIHRPWDNTADTLRPCKLNLFPQNNYTSGTHMYRHIIYLLTYARLLAGSMGHRSNLSTGSCAVPGRQFPAKCTPSSSLPDHVSPPGVSWPSSFSLPLEGSM